MNGAVERGFRRWKAPENSRIGWLRGENSCGAGRSSSGTSVTARDLISDVIVVRCSTTDSEGGRSTSGKLQRGPSSVSPHCGGRPAWQATSASVKTGPVGARMAVMLSAVPRGGSIAERERERLGLHLIGHALSRWRGVEDLSEGVRGRRRRQRRSGEAESGTVWRKLPEGASERGNISPGGRQSNSIAGGAQQTEHQELLQH
ncbi:hypothetical protein B0J12DRAFT_413364 [Macrophomina phaseolina]|uniref:Uncharacterized protein n=1 Tax=Macrophomina phaseolina TaxID=35725 RepID=A0ABQ8GJF0_9PEZI|nr:hypothetical protein B0J12DRAFT_413364 [Macrophomina phaseolina]